MKKICHQCQTEMIEDCKVTVEGAMYGIKISQKRKGIFKRTSAIPRAAVCPSCGYVALYIDEYREFK